MKYLFTILLFLGTFHAKAQTVLGKVTDANSGEKIIGATVKLLGSDKGAITDSVGAFSIDGIGTFQISFIGYKTFKVKSKGLFLSIDLLPDTTDIQEVEVVGCAAKDYTSDYSFAATRTATPNKQIPQSISTVTKELMAAARPFNLPTPSKSPAGSFLPATTTSTPFGESARTKRGRSLTECALLLDEPTFCLDPKAANEFSVILKELAKEGTAVLMATHDIFRAREVATRIGIMREGTLVSVTEAKDISANELEALYLQTV